MSPNTQLIQPSAMLSTTSAKKRLLRGANSCKPSLVRFEVSFFGFSASICPSAAHIISFIRGNQHNCCKEFGGSVPFLVSLHKREAQIRGKFWGSVEALTFRFQFITIQERRRSSPA